MIERSIVVAVPPERAFRAWTEKIGLWWPPAHHPSGDPAGRVALESGVGGRLYEAAPDGRELAMGRVLAWDPPDRLRLAFYLGGGAEHPSEVEIRFVAVDAGTRVEVRHEAGALGDRFDLIAERFERNWEVVLAAFGQNHLH